MKAFKDTFACFFFLITDDEKSQKSPTLSRATINPHHANSLHFFSNKNKASAAAGIIFNTIF